MGRPSSYTPELAEEICERIADGKSLTSVCLAGNMPTPHTVRAWLRAEPDFLADYTRAREDSADSDADAIRDLADNCDLTQEAIAKAKQQIDVRKWSAGRRKPKIYGDHMGQVALGEGGNTVQLIIMPSGTSAAEVDRTIDVSQPRLSGIVSESGGE